VLSQQNAVPPPPGFDPLDFRPIFPDRILHCPPEGYDSVASATCEWHCSSPGRADIFKYLPDSFFRIARNSLGMIVFAPVCTYHETDQRLEQIDSLIKQQQILHKQCNSHTPANVKTDEHVTTTVSHFPHVKCSK
jgi:hypothetical protein